MKALTLEILGGGFLSPSTFSLLLQAICITASRQGVKYFLKPQLCFCRLSLNRKKAHSPERAENVVPRPGMAAVGQPAWEGMAACGSLQGVSRVQPLHLNSACQKRSRRFTLLSFVCLPTLFISTLRLAVTPLRGDKPVPLALCCREGERLCRAVRSSH